ILIHCHQGADRTGLASAIALLLYTDASLDESLRQLGPSYGHVALGRTAHVDRFFSQYRDWLSEEGRCHSPAAFRAWAGQNYCRDGGRADFEVVGPDAGVVRVRCGESKKVTVRCHNRSRTPWRFEPGVTAGVHGHWRVIDGDDRLVTFGRTGLRR